MSKTQAGDRARKAEIAVEIGRLAELSEPEYEGERVEAAKKLGWRPTALDRFVRTAREHLRSRANGQATDDGRPVINVEAGRIDKAVDAGEKALLAAGADIFQRGDRLVRPGHHEVTAADDGTTIAAGLHAVTGAALASELCAVARWQKFDGRARENRAIDPPGAAVLALLAGAGRWRLRSIAGVISCPTLRPDGSLLATSGYDAATRLYYLPDPKLCMPGLPERPTRDNAASALTELIDLFSGFPFVSDVDRSVALSLAISAVVRGALGQVPVHAFSAPTAGTGKSYLADVTTAITSGRWCPVITPGRTEDETEKRLGGMLLAGYPIIALDNISTVLGGDKLCQLVTQPTVCIRVLGKNDSPEFDFRGLIIANGNNLVIAGDLTRRTLVGRLDAGMERPEDREFVFDPVARVLADRGRYVAAAMTVVRAYLAAGSPGPARSLASFGRWSDLVRSALIWLGEADPVESMREGRESDPILGTLRAAVTNWQAAFGDKAMTVRAVIEAMEKAVLHKPEHGPVRQLRDVLMPVCGGRSGLDAVKVGNWLRRNKGRVAEGLRFMPAGAVRGGAMTWRVEEATMHGDAVRWCGCGSF